MAKRFTATEIWDEDWFLEMPNEYKLFWYYVLSKCDHAGLFRVNIKHFCSLNDVRVAPQKALAFFNNGKNRIREISETIWLIEDFFVFQYGTTFNPCNRVHASIEKAYNQLNIKLTSIRGLLDLKDGVKDKDIVLKKGSMRENKNGKLLKGEKFDENFVYVYFPDGTKQELGEQQKELAVKGFTKPYMIIQSQIY